MRWTLPLLLLATAVGEASPNVSLDDPRYDEVSDAFVGGLRPLTERRLDELLELPDRQPPSWWARPITRVMAHLVAARDPGRPYSVPARPRDVVGLLAVTCEHVEGNPCGSGAGVVTELDSAVGYARWISIASRVQAVAGSDSYAPEVSLDRLYLDAELGPIAAEVGRDVIVIGPSSRTQLAWGDNAAPLDHVRLSTTAPYALTSSLDGSVAWIVGRLRAPQRYPGNLVSLTRGQLDIANALEIGVTQMLQTGGDGAPKLGLWGFVLEHVRRADLSATETDSSNRRLGLDVAARIAGGRLYYAWMFEDVRKRFHDAIRHDADHLLGAEAHDVTVELHKTGVRSQEHSPRTTGFTNRGTLVGSPLGPDALSLYASARIAVASITLRPWAEVARLSSATYTFVEDGPISKATRGVSEVRYRVGATVRVPLRAELALEAEAMVEHVERFAFEPGQRRTNAGASVSAVFTPRRDFR